MSATLKMVTVQDAIDGKRCPLPIDVIPNQMGINLSAVDCISWSEQDDGQLLHLSITFKPAPSAA